MINSKLEKVLIVLVWYVFLITFRLVLPIEEPPGNVDKYIIIFLSVITTLAVYHVYAYYRNRHVLNKINILLENNELDKAEEYINKCSLKQKKCRAVYMYKLYTIAMCGHIGEFEEELSKCKQLKKYKNLLDWDFIKGLKSIIGYFKTCDSTVVLSGNGYWGEIMNVLSLQNKEENKRFICFGNRKIGYFDRVVTSYTIKLTTALDNSIIKKINSYSSLLIFSYLCILSGHKAHLVSTE